jgi:hypothetical protein
MATKTQCDLKRFAENLIIDMYESGEYKNLDRYGLTGEGILDAFITYEFGGVTRNLKSIKSLLGVDSTKIITKAIKSARNKGIPVIPVREAFFDMTDDDISFVDNKEDAAIYVSTGHGKPTFGCKFCPESLDIDYFYMAWHYHLGKCSNGGLKAVQNVAISGNRGGLAGYKSNSKLVRDTGSKTPLLLPQST